MNDPLASPLLIRKVEKNGEGTDPPHTPQRAYAAGQSSRRRKPSPRRARAIVRALKREPHRTVSSKALARQARRTARRRKRA